MYLLVLGVIVSLSCICVYFVSFILTGYLSHYNLFCVVDWIFSYFIICFVSLGCSNVSETKVWYGKRFELVKLMFVLNYIVAKCRNMSWVHVLFNKNFVNCCETEGIIILQLYPFCLYSIKCNGEIRLLYGWFLVVKALCYKPEGRGCDTRWGDF
jgi:hypothetical protein